MANDDWYRNENWNSKIEEEFLNRLKRARKKGQYLRIQANCLINRHPKVALKLLEDYFSQDELSDYSVACSHKAKAYIELGDIPKAIEAYEGALAREEIFPGMMTNSYLELPFLIATRNLEDSYQRALDVLNKYSSRLTAFPVNFFMWYASQALILNALDRKSEAQPYAKKALEAADKKESEFRYHRNLGLVGGKYEPLKKLLVSIAK